MNDSFGQSVAIWAVLLLSMLTLGLSVVLNPLISGAQAAEVGWLSFFFGGLLGTMLASLLQMQNRRIRKLERALRE